MKRTLPSMLILLFALSAQVHAADPQAAFTATSDVLFELDIENASFKVRHDGYVTSCSDRPCPTRPWTRRWKS